MVKYITDDGTIFSTEREALEYEDCSTVFHELVGLKNQINEILEGNPDAFKLNVNELGFLSVAKNGNDKAEQLKKKVKVEPLGYNEFKKLMEGLIG